MHVSRLPLHVIDFEGSNRSGVVEFGYVVLVGDRIELTRTSLCRPCGNVSEQETQVHGLAGAALMHLEEFSTFFDEFVALRRTGIFAAHNRHAENNFLRSAWPLPPPVPDWGDAQRRLCNDWGPWVDTLAIYRTLYPGFDDYGLGALVDRMDCRETLNSLAAIHCPEARRRPHCALYDALASAVLIMRLLAERGPGEVLDPLQLLALSTPRDVQGELF